MNNLNTTTNIKFSLLAGLDSSKRTDKERVCRIIYKAKSKEEPKKASIGANIPTISSSDLDEILYLSNARAWATMELTKMQNTLLINYIASPEYDEATGIPDSIFGTAALLAEIASYLEKELPMK